MTAMPQTPLRLLIVDDNPEDRELYHRLLERNPEGTYHVFEAETGEEGLALCRTERLDGVLLDYRLPDLDGLEFLTVLAGESSTVSVPVIMLTGGGNEMIVAEAMRAGAADYLPKSSLSTKSLDRAISNAVEKHKLCQALDEQRQILAQTNQELHRQNEEIQSFYHMLSHELKTPLTAAREFVSFVLDGLVGPLTDEQREYLGLAKDSCDQMTLGLSDLLDVTRMDTGKLHITPRPTYIGAVVSRVIVSMTPVAEDKEIVLQSTIAPDLPDVLIDEKRITQVLTNLLSNALKFTSVGGEVVVSVDNDPQRPAWVLVLVRDTGRGIAPEQLEFIFDRLYQVQSDDASMEGGLGLSLHICQEVVRLHGGEIWVDNRLGKGSTFFFTLPTHEAYKAFDTAREEV
jgi:signal transduction histidine kinase